MNPATIKNIRQLANFLQCDESFLKAYLEGDFYIIDVKNPSNVVSRTDWTTIIEKLYIPKKNRHKNDYREIYSIQTDTLKNSLKGFNTFLQSAVNPSTAAHGYVTGRNIRTNAEAHLAKKHLLSIDLHKFFETISDTKIEQVLLSIDFSPFAAQHLSKFVTINGFLPPGFNTSPTLSNLIVKVLDEQFIRLCGTDCSYTRYADDLYFSSNVALPTNTDIEQIITANGFSLNPDKTKYMTRGRKQYVTGLTVFDSIRPHVTRSIKRRLRLELHYIEKYGILEHALRKSSQTIDEYANDTLVRSTIDNAIHYIKMTIAGWIHFMKSVELPAAIKFDVQFKKIFEVVSNES